MGLAWWICTFILIQCRRRKQFLVFNFLFCLSSLPPHTLYWCYCRNQLRLHLNQTHLGSFPVSWNISSSLWNTSVCLKPEARHVHVIHLFSLIWISDDHLAVLISSSVRICHILLHKYNANIPLMLLLIISYLWGQWRIVPLSPTQGRKCRFFQLFQTDRWILDKPQRGRLDACKLLLLSERSVCGRTHRPCSRLNFTDGHIERQVQRQRGVMGVWSELWCPSSNM